MPRPRKWKKICCLPERNLFGPLDREGMNNKTIRLAIEEYETLRLIDLENLTQEECAERMNIGRTTVQKLYNEARFKLSDSLINGYILKIEGGDYILYDDRDEANCHGCHQIRCGRNL